jgi:hypothetical protein
MSGVPSCKEAPVKQHCEHGGNDEEGQETAFFSYAGEYHVRVSGGNDIGISQSYSPSLQSSG